jgi:hypothetical protein
MIRMGIMEGEIRT